VLAGWAYPFALSEVEFLVLWRLHGATADGFDQRTLAGELAFSPAQVSATVERLRARELIVGQLAPSDRRRHLWCLSAGGRVLLERLVEAAALLHRDPSRDNQRDSREVAA
jgi:DNA-binding MarR family transcriptional regulator